LNFNPIYEITKEQVMTQHNGLKSGLSMLSGAALGAVFMYLMDPEKGPERRQHAQDLAHDAMAKAGTRLGATGASIGSAGASAAHAVEHAASSAGESASSLWSSLAAKTRDLANSIGEQAHRATSSAADTGADAMHATRDTVSNLTGRARSVASDAYDRARTHMGHEQSSYAAPIAISASSAGLLGLAAWYFLDARRGQARRQRVYNMACDLVDGTAEMARNVGARLTERSPRPMDYATSDDYVGQVPPVPPAVAENDLSLQVTAPKVM
jgi:hypothetical protein